mgnify:CR=1 FL=1
MPQVHAQVEKKLEILSQADSGAIKSRFLASAIAGWLRWRGLPERYVSVIIIDPELDHLFIDVFICRQRCYYRFVDIELSYDPLAASASRTMSKELERLLAKMLTELTKQFDDTVYVFYNTTKVCELKGVGNIDECAKDVVKVMKIDFLCP